MSQALHSELLTLVRPQVDATLAQIAEAAGKHAATPNNATIAPGVGQAHQVAGALRMVQLPGAARFATEIETALKAALRGTPADATEVAIAGRAATTLREFVNDVAGGANYVPLRLFAAFRDLSRVGGNATASEKDLFFPPVVDNAPPHANPRAITPAVLPALVKDLRSRFQRGLLAWLKESAKPDGPTQMRNVLDQLHQIAAQLPEPRGLWWAATQLMDSVVELLPNPQAAEWLARIKPVCSRIDFLLRDLAAAAKADTAPAQRDVYYAIASCRLAPTKLRDAQRVLELEHLIPEIVADGAQAPSQQPLLDDARTRLENLKELWTEYVAGEPNRLAHFRELVGPLTQKARDLGNLPLLQLLLAISNSTAQLPDPYPLDGQVMSLEMASALLMAESIVSHYHDLPPDLEQQVGIMKSWLAEAVTGKIATATPPGLRADIVQKANDEKLRMATAREIIKNLQQVEKVVEAYASDPAKRPTLAPLTATLRQVQGVFEVSNQKRAARLALACQHLIERCARTTVGSPGEAGRDIEWLAEGLGCLGFYLDPCLHGKEPNERAINLYFTRYEKQEGLEALLGLSQQIAVSKPSVTTEPGAAAPAAAPAQPAVDREMLEVFLEEANEVLTAMESSIAQAREGSGDHDALLNVRRGFHTLKGSSRMVGLTAYGECAWDMEQVMNHWLAQSLMPTPELLDLAGDARELLAEWAHALQGETQPTIDAAPIAARARALRGVTPPPQHAVPPTAPGAARTTVPTTALPPAPTPVQPIQDMETMLISATGRMQINVQPAAAALAAAPLTPVAHESVTPVPVSSNTMRITTVPQMATPVYAYTQTLADLGEHLTRMGELADEIRRETQGSPNLRLAKTANTLNDGMREAQTLHQKLRDLLVTLKT